MPEGEELSVGADVVFQESPKRPSLLIENGSEVGRDEERQRKIAVDTVQHGGNSCLIARDLQ